MKVSDRHYYPLPTSLEELLEDERKLLDKENCQTEIESLKQTLRPEMHFHEKDKPSPHLKSTGFQLNI